MEKQTLNYRKDRYGKQVESEVVHLSQTARNLAVTDGLTGWQTDETIPGLQIAPTASISILGTELGNPYPLLRRGMEIVRPTNGGDGQDIPGSECLPVTGRIEANAST